MNISSTTTNAPRVTASTDSTGAANVNLPKQQEKSELANKRQLELQVSKEEISNMVENTNQFMETIRKSLHFQLHEDTNRMVVEIRDLDTDEVIKELPPKEFLDMVARIRDYVGLMIDEKI